MVIITVAVDGVLLCVLLMPLPARLSLLQVAANTKGIQLVEELIQEYSLPVVSSTRYITQRHARYISRPLFEPATAMPGHIRIYRY